jgi:acetyl-CoA carboxylase biotin carboxyl carrier protein
MPGVIWLLGMSSPRVLLREDCHRPEFYQLVNFWRDPTVPTAPDNCPQMWQPAFDKPCQLSLSSPESLAYKRETERSGQRNRSRALMTKHPHDADVAFIQALAELLRENDLTELQVKRDYGEHDSLNVRVSRGGTVVAQVAPAPMAIPASLPAPSAAMPAATAALAAEAASDPARHPGAVTSPMVGTCYLSPEPGAAAFVKVGDAVAEGQTVLIIEAMKTMNQIPAPRAGTIKRILVEDATPVEYGAPLMIIE